MTNEAAETRKLTRTMVVDFLMVALLLAGAGVWAVTTYLREPPYIDREKYQVRGVDLSSHNGFVDFEALADDDVDFVFLKATEGTDWRDDSFASNYRRAKEAGLKVGAYHFFKFDSDGPAQAANLLKTIEGLDLDLGLAIDVERHSNPADVTAAEVAEKLHEMADCLNLEGHRITFYTNTRGYYEFLEAEFKGQPLWVCGFSDPPVQAEWDFWQYSHSGKVHGADGPVDMNVFRGTRQEWIDYLLSRQERRPAHDAPSQ